MDSILIIIKQLFKIIGRVLFWLTIFFGIWAILSHGTQWGLTIANDGFVGFLGEIFSQIWNGIKSFFL